MYMGLTVHVYDSAGYRQLPPDIVLPRAAVKRWRSGGRIHEVIQGE